MATLTESRFSLWLLALAANFYVLKGFRPFGSLDLGVVCLALYLVLFSKNLFYASNVKINLHRYQGFIIIIGVSVSIFSLLGNSILPPHLELVVFKSWWNLGAVWFCLLICYLIPTASFASFLRITLVIGQIVLLANLAHLLFSYDVKGGFKGFSGNPNQISSYACYIAACCVLLNDRVRLFNFSIVFGSGLLISYFANSSSGFLFFCFIFPFAFFLGRIKASDSKKIITLIAFGAALVPAGIWAIYSEQPFFQDIVRKIYASRFELWPDYWYLIRETYGLGYGPGKFASVIPGEFIGAQEAHNIYLDMALNFSVVSAVLVLLFQLFGCIQFLKVNRLDCLIIWSGLLALGLFMNIFRHPLFWILLWVPFIPSFDLRLRGLNALVGKRNRAV